MGAGDEEQARTSNGKQGERKQAHLILNGLGLGEEEGRKI